MIYDFLGKKMTEKEVQKELIMNPDINLSSAYVYLRAQQKLNAERRLKTETDPTKKAIMEEIFNTGHYNFDAYLKYE